MPTIDDYYVYWTPASGVEGTPPGEILVTQRGDESRWKNGNWSDCYAYVSGTCYTARHAMSLEGKVLMMFIDFHTCVTRDGIDPQRAHREFLKIDEYRCRISPELAGARS
jgi:hypothetical protein